MSASDRLKRYVENKKRLGLKRVSFFVDVKFWKFITKNAKKENLTILEYLKKIANFK